MVPVNDDQQNNTHATWFYTTKQPRIGETGITFFFSFIFDSINYQPLKNQDFHQVVFMYIYNCKFNSKFPTANAVLAPAKPMYTE